MSTAAVTPPNSSTQTTTRSSSASLGGMDSTFMTLLITQLKNQDPTQPMDPSTFVSQLVEVNSLDQVTQINQLLQKTLSNSTSTSSTPAPSTGGR
jgi:flagellar basal-body rod modification protein FlgD